MSDLYQRAEKKVDAKIGFYYNFGIYLIVNTFLAIINWIFTPYFWWVLFPVFFWGIGVFVKFLKAFVLYENFYSEDYRQRKIQEEMEKMKDEGEFVCFKGY